MQVIPGTHRLDQQLHHDTHADANMLSRGQVIQMPVDEQAAVDTVLQPGEISLHHIRLIHGSKPNPSDDRRIGFAIRYIPPHLHQINGPEDLAMLVRGEDPHHNFELEVRPESDMHPDAIEHHARAAELHGQLLYQGTDRQPFT
jgi:ectoine hydroxylase-related dioxygenase (phytanoyl-CoA dioxygenase family)